MEINQFFGLGLVPVLIALGQFLKSQDFPAKRLPIPIVLIAVVLNVGLAWYLKTDLAVGAFMGLLAGLTASGFYSSQKSLRGM